MLHTKKVLWEESKKENKSEKPTDNNADAMTRPTR
jgi:hypothetical protein